MSLILTIIFNSFYQLSLLIYALLRHWIGPKSKFPLVNKNVLVTGAGNGIGRELALQLASKRNTVVLMDISENAANQVAEEIRRRGQKCHVEICDVSKKENVDKAAEQIRAAVGDIDVLINNAGVATVRSFLELTETQVIRELQINVCSLFWTMQAFLPAMIKHRSGHILNVASGVGVMPIGKMSSYSASKSAVIGLHEAVRMELQMMGLDEQITMTYACPSFVQTRMMPRPEVASSFKMLPALTPEGLAAKMISAIENRRESLLVPFMVLPFSILRAIIPVKVWMYMFAQNEMYSELKKTDFHSTQPVVTDK